MWIYTSTPPFNLLSTGTVLPLPMKLNNKNILLREI
jgi:hypothetical protein